MKTYKLTAKGKKFAAEANPKTHAGAVVSALKKLGKATSAEIVAEVKKSRNLSDSKMEVRDAVSFMLFDLGKRRGILSSR